MKYPNFVYKCPGRHFCEGNTYDYQLVNDENELKKQLELGWYPTLEMAKKGERSTGNPAVSPKVVNLNEASRAQLEKTAKELKVPFNKRTKSEKLRINVQNKLKARDKQE